MERFFMAAGGLAGLTAVAMAAAAAHLPILPGQEEAMRSAVQMHGWHALALLGCALWLPRGGGFTLLAGMAFIIGLLLFCGTVYAHALGLARIAVLAPVGGTLLMAGWALLGLTALRR